MSTPENARFANLSIYDTTLRDGAQHEGVNFSPDGKIEAIRLLGALGVHYIEVGWPGAIPVDTIVFSKVRDVISLEHVKLAAFGSTRRKNLAVDEDAQLEALIAAKPDVVTLVGKASPEQVQHVLQTSKDNNLAMIEESIRYMRDAGIGEIGFDAEHFFDGFNSDPNYALQTLYAAARAGSDWVALCDTNGGTMPWEIAAIVQQVVQDERLQEVYRQAHRFADPTTRIGIGIHTHDDGGTAVASSLVAIRAGATQFQGCINGYGERVGNANSITVMANLYTKMGWRGITEEQLRNFTTVSRTFDNLTNYRPVRPPYPYVGVEAFANKAGQHQSAVNRFPRAYTHVDPSLFGNESRTIVSDQSGRASISAFAEQLTLPFRLTDEDVNHVLTQVKERSAAGYRFDYAPASAELIIRRCEAGYQLPFILRTHYRPDGTFAAADLQIALKTKIPGQIEEGNNYQTLIPLRPQIYDIPSRFETLKHELMVFYEQLALVKLVNNRIEEDNGSVKRVLLELTNGDRQWTIVAADNSLAVASWLALSDSFEYALLQNIP